MPRARHHARLAALTALCVAAAGCAGSRWARDHPGYAAKYPRHTGNLARMTKQAVDARHVAGEDGWYAGASGRDEPTGAAVHLGKFVYPGPLKGMVETRIGLQALVAEGDNPLSGGFEGGVRVQSPSRLAPFVGVGAYAGYVPDMLAADDGRDNNGNGFIDEADEDNSTAVLAAFPEVGVHYWLTSRLRATASASYYVTSINENSDFALYGFSLSYLPFGSRTEYVPPADCGAPVEAQQEWPSEAWPNAGEPPSEPWPEPAASSSLNRDAAVVHTAYESLMPR